MLSLKFSNSLNDSFLFATSESWMETLAAPVSQDGGPLARPGVIDPGLDFVVGLVLAISSGIYTDRKTYRDRLKCMQILLSNSQAEQLSNNKKKFLATTYDPFSRTLYT